MECTLSQERISVWSIQHSFLVLIRCFVPSVWTKTIKTKARESERFHEPFYHNARIIRDINISSSSRAYQLTTGYSRKWLTRTVCETREGGIALNIGFRSRMVMWLVIAVLYRTQSVNPFSRISGMLSRALALVRPYGLSTLCTRQRDRSIFLNNG